MRDDLPGLLRKAADMLEHESPLPLERFDYQALRLLRQAMEEATDAGDDFVGREHILLALIRGDNGGFLRRVVVSHLIKDGK